ncbi:hypothetical protein PR002_g15389 [Phytophthora rubi]|uniref:Uncharacterized protein n=1 Tax=Phytophthora rubi TaxID=129364 RepID=A0A6A3KSM4_9STRA|nr:hypothetical protein PR002_g15389 [Phytophthora rubi]
MTSPSAQVGNRQSERSYFSSPHTYGGGTPTNGVGTSSSQLTPLIAAALLGSSPSSSSRDKLLAFASVGSASSSIDASFSISLASTPAARASEPSDTTRTSASVFEAFESS